MMPYWTDQDSSLPPAAIFNRYFVGHPEWRVRECYLGRQDPAELAKMPAFAEEFAALLSEIRDHINQTYDVQRHRVKVRDVHPRLHFDYIKVKSTPCAGLKPLPRSNALAFQAGGIHFVGVTVPLMQELLQVSLDLVRLGRITGPFGFRPHEQGRRRSFINVLFATMLQFVASHELGHHFHGRQGREAEETGDPMSFYDESPSSTSTTFPASHVKEVEADGYAVKMVMNNLMLGRPREATLRLLGQRDSTEHSEKHLLRLFVLATGGFFFSRAVGEFDTRGISESGHPPKVSRMHFIMTGLREWCRENKQGTLLRHLKLKPYQRMMRAVKDATDRTGTGLALYQESAFLNSPEGRGYLALITQEVPRVRASMDPWRWYLVDEPTGTAPSQGPG
jgi:hypothetical protein